MSAVAKRLTSKRTPITRKEPIHVTGGSCLEVKLGISLPEGCYLTKGVTSPWQVMTFKLQEGENEYSLMLCGCKSLLDLFEL